MADRKPTWETSVAGEVDFGPVGLLTAGPRPPQCGQASFIGPGEVCSVSAARLHGLGQPPVTGSESRSRGLSYC